MNKIKVKAQPANTEAVFEFVTTGLESHGAPSGTIPEILIAVEEIFLNIAQHAYPPDQEGEASIYISFGSEAVIRFEDSGKPFNPLEREGPNLDVPLMEREIGGLGIHFVKNLMDKVEYEYTGGKNVLTITKSIQAQDKGVSACSRV